MTSKPFNKLAALIVLLSGFGLNSTAQAQSAEAYLKIIATNTTLMLTVANVQLQKIVEFSNAWLDPDKSDTTANMQSTFSRLGQLISSRQNAQGTLQYKINNDLLNTAENSAFAAGYGIAVPTPVTPANAATILPYANDLLYSTLINQPWLAKDTRKNVDPAYNFVRNASGLNIYHPLPNAGWKGAQSDVARYQNYFNVAISSESFGAYVLSALYAENEITKKDKNMIDLRNQLLKQATDASWFTTVASEQIGIVLRQLLIYQSQLFVLMNESHSVQKQLLTAQVMNNAILLAGNQQLESLLVNRAQSSTG